MWLPKFAFLRSKLNLSKFLQMRLNSWIIAWLPFWLSRLYLRGLGRLYYCFNRKEKKLIEDTVSYVLGKKLAGRALRRAKRQTFQGIFDHYHEKLYLAYTPFSGLHKFFEKKMRFEGEEALQEALAQGKGAILSTGHFGAVEFLPAVLAFRGYKVAIICRFQTNRLRDTLVSRAQEVDLQIIDSEAGNCLLAALKALKQGRIIITEADEFDEWKAKDDHRLSFLGASLDYDRALDILHKRSGAPVVSALVSRQGRGYALHLQRVTAAVPAPRRIGEKCLEILEEMCLAYPTQWYQWKKFGKMIAPQVAAAQTQVPVAAGPAPMPYQYAY